MEVRLTTTLEVPYAVQDATGTVISIEFDDSDAAVHEHNLKDPVLQNLKISRVQQAVFKNLQLTSVHSHT